MPPQHRNKQSVKSKKNFKNKPSSGRKPTPANFLYGAHTVEAALKNPARKLTRLRATQNAADKLNQLIQNLAIKPEIVPPQDLDKILGPDVVHQGMLLEADPLPMADLEALEPGSLVLVLDQITDPHNVGAIIRSAAAFGVKALVMTQRNSPPLCGVLAKSASGGLEYVPICLVPNISRALENLADLGFWRIGLDSEGEGCLEEAEQNGSIALVLGAEGKGLRRLTREHCDEIARIRTGSNLASLNVSNAAAIALHSTYLMMAKS